MFQKKLQRISCSYWQLALNNGGISKDFNASFNIIIGWSAVCNTIALSHTSSQLSSDALAMY